MTTVLLDPTAELGAASRQPLPTPESLAGLTIGLLDISKAKGETKKWPTTTSKSRGLDTEASRF